MNIAITIFQRITYFSRCKSHYLSHWDGEMDPQSVIGMICSFPILSNTPYTFTVGDRKKTAYINNRVKHILVQNLTRNVLHVYTLSSVPTSNINCFWEVIVTKFFFCHSLQNLPKPSHFHSVIFHSRTFSSWVLQAFKPGTFLVFFQVKDIL